MSQRFIHHRRPEETLLEPVDTKAELRLLGVGDVEDKVLIVCEETGYIYRYDYESVAVDNDDTILEPTGGQGAWIATGTLASSQVVHNETDGLQGGTTDEYYHLTEAEHSEVETGVAEGGFRLKWSQEQQYTTDDTGVINSGEELIIQSLTVDGDLTVNGELVAVGQVDDNRLWRRRWSQSNTVESYEYDMIAEDSHLVIVGDLVVDGDLDVQGILLQVDSIPSLSQVQSEVFVRTESGGPVTALANDLIEADASGGPMTVNLPPAPTPGNKVIINKVDASGNLVTVGGNGNNINGAPTFTGLALQYDSGTFIFGSTQWLIV